MDAALRAPAYGKSKFKVKVYNQAMYLRKTLLAYLGTASDFTGMLRYPDIRKCR